MEGNYHWQSRTTWFVCKEGITPSDVERRLSAFCGQKARACGTVFSWVRGFSSGKESAQWVVSQQP